MFPAQFEDGRYWECGLRASQRRTHIDRSLFTWNRLLGELVANLNYSITAEIKSEDDLIAPGAKPGTVPTDYIQATGLERLELIGKMQGIDIFDMRPLDASRKGMSDLNAQTQQAQT